MSKYTFFVINWIQLPTINYKILIFLFIVKMDRNYSTFRDNIENDEEAPLLNENGKMIKLQFKQPVAI